MYLFYLKSAIRNLLQNKVYASISILGFAISFTVCIMIALYVQHEYSYDKCYANHERIYRVIDKTKDRNETTFDYNVNSLFKTKYPEIENACPIFMHTNWKNTIQLDDKTIYFHNIISTNQSFFEIFNIADELGRPVGFNEGTDEILITRSLANQLSPDKDITGKIIKLMNEYDLKIIGIIPDFPENSSLFCDVIMNAENSEYRFSSYCNNGDCFNPCNHYVLLEKNTDLTAIEKEINSSLESYHTRVKKIEFQLLTDIYLDNSEIDSRNKAGNKVFIKLLVIISLLILIISVINYVNFTNSMQYAQLKKVGIQKSVGARSKQLFLYQFTEVILWISMAIVFSVILTYILIPFFSALFNTHLAFSSIFTLPILGLITGVLISVCLIASITPLIIVYKGQVSHLIKNTKISDGKLGGRTILTSIQLVVSIILLVSIILIKKQLQFIKHKDLGFEKEQLLLVNTPHYFDKHDVLKEELLKHNNIRSLSYTRGGPGNIFASMGNGLDDNYFDLQCISVDTNFLETFGIKLLKGRNFLPSGYGKACIINMEAYQRYGWKDLVNKNIMNRGLEVVGVVDNFHIASLYDPIEPVCLLYDIKNSSFINLRLSGSNIGNTMDYVEKTWKDISGNLPFEYQFYDAYFDSMYKKDESLARNISLFAFIAMVLTVLGIFGQIFHLCIVKTKEIGIRKVNGAKVSEILALLNSNFVKWVFLAFIIATPIAWYLMKKWLANFAYKTSMDWWVFGVAGLIVLLITVFTISWQSWNVAKKNPVEALRYE